jgi:hypothetical protein
MVRMERRLWLLVLLILPWLTIAEAHAASRRIVSIEAARQLPAGTVVTVAGVASTPSGIFESSFFDKGFAVAEVPVAHPGEGRRCYAGSTIPG